MPEYFTSFMTWVNNTQVPAQLSNVDIKGLFHNPYFLVPFIVLMVYYLYKQAVNNIVITGLLIGLWWFSGSSMVKGALVDGIVQLDKVLPIIGVGIGGIAVLIYLLFIRQE